MADTRGTFRLKNVRQDILKNEYVPIPAVWTLAALDDAGYIAGGTDGPGPYNSRYDKIAYSTDTKSTLTAVLSGNIAARGGASSPTAGYTMGGLEPSSPAGKTSKIDKLTYATSTNSQLTGTLDDSQTWGSAGGGSSTAGYLCGGYNPDISDIRKVTYATDTIETLPANISNPAGANYNMGSAGNADDFLYLIGGASGTGNEAKKFTYSNESCSNIPTMPAPGSYNRSQKAGCSSSSSAAYISGGSNPTWNAINKTTFSNDTTSYVTNSTTLRMQVAGTGSPSAGYFAGGSDLSSTERITMSTESNARVPALDLTIGGKRQTGISAKQDNRGAPNPKRWFDDAAPTGNKMYCIGGTSSSDHDTFNMTTETAASLALPSLPSMTKGCSAQNTTHSYIHAGPGKQTKVRKITWSTDTGTTLPGTTSRSAESKSGTGNETKGYFTQGASSPGPCYSGSDRVTYASDTIERVPGADMVGGRPGKFGAQATGNQETGYFMGGGGEWPGFPNYSDTNKLTYATDTNANCPAQMPTGMSMYAGSSASSSTAAYASNYRNPSFHSKVFKLVFATDTVDTVGNTTVQRNGPAMGGNGTTMYMGGGSNFPNGDRSDFDKLVYATDTFSNLPDANLQSARYYTIGSGQRGERIPVAEPPTATPTSPTTLTGPQGIKAEGYLIQGIQGVTTTPTGRTDVYKLNYNTDTWDSSVTAYSILTRKNGGAASNTTAAYIAGGTMTRVVGGTNHANAMDKLTYATSTMTRIPSSDAGDIPGPAAANKQCAAGNQTQGYWAFGPAQSKCSKLTYSSETGSNLPNLPWNAKNSVGVSMQTAGYYGSGDGFDDENTSFVKITFSNDSYAAYSGWFYQPGGFGARYRCGSSSSTKAYIVGGQNAVRCMDVIPWATNSTSNSPTTFLQSPGFYKAPGQGSNEAGYFTGGAQVGNNGTTTEKITYASDTSAIVPSAYFPTSESNGVNSYSTGGPNMNGLGTNTPNVI